METKKIIGTLLIAFGLLGLVPGVLGIFEKKELLGINSWALTIFRRPFLHFWHRAHPVHPLADGRVGHPALPSPQIT